MSELRDSDGDEGVELSNVKEGGVRRKKRSGIRKELRGSDRVLIEVIIFFEI